MNSKGIAALFLIIAMLLMVTIGYVLSYLVPTKQKSVRFPIYSNQAFFIAQSGVEYGIRYGSDHGWRSGTALLGLNNPGVNQRNLGNGRFTISYDNAADRLTSTGEITNSNEKRIVELSNFSKFFRLFRLIFDPACQAPCFDKNKNTIRFCIKNVGESSVTLNAFSATWTQTGGNIKITKIEMDGDRKFSGNYTKDAPPEPFVSNHTIVPNGSTIVDVTWHGDVKNATSIIITFYAGTDGYPFNLDPEGDGITDC